MHKIIAAVNSMIEHDRLISQIRRNDNVYYFVYDNKYKWSIAKSDGIYYLAFYPGSQTISELIRMSDENPVFEDYMVAYNTGEIKTREAVESFSELYQVVQNKVFGIDSILDEIINTAK